MTSTRSVSGRVMAMSTLELSSTSTSNLIESLASSRLVSSSDWLTSSQDSSGTTTASGLPAKSVRMICRL
ncbi:hypothetical protein D3C84_1309470 [compost metagenome]